MLEKLVEFGLAGAVMGLVMYIVVRPLVNALVAQVATANEQLSAAREEREKLCARHHDFHNRTITILEGLRASVDALVRRANGAKS